MAALLPTILSDDEEETNAVVVAKSSSGSGVGNKKRARKQHHNDPNDDGNSSSSSDGESTTDEMDGDFEFGGLLVRIVLLLQPCNMNIMLHMLFILQFCSSNFLQIFCLMYFILNV